MIPAFSPLSKLRRYYRTKTLADWYWSGHRDGFLGKRPSTTRIESIDQWVHRAVYDAGHADGTEARKGWERS
jgi:hypothetical protein